jgi:peptide/nickel transport system permease protein
VSASDGASTTSAAKSFGNQVVTGIYHSRTVRVITRRLLLAIPLLFVVSMLTFVLIASIPGNAADVLLGSQVFDPAALKEAEHQLGLDAPLYLRYWHWLGHAVHGDLGSSLVNQQAVSTAITNTRLGVTLSLIFFALLITTIIGVGLGMLSAIRGGAVGRGIDTVSLFGYATPSFWLGAVLITIFAVRLQWLPAVGYQSLSSNPTGYIRSLTMPVLALSVVSAAIVARYTREAMLEALASEHVRNSWANGVSPTSIYFRHALKNAGPRVITTMGVITVGLLTGTVLVETVFALPGLGSLAVSATNTRDLPMIQGIVLLFTCIVIVVNLLVDLAYAWLNPRALSS